MSQDGKAYFIWNFSRFMVTRFPTSIFSGPHKNRLRAFFVFAKILGCKVRNSRVHVVNGNAVTVTPNFQKVLIVAIMCTVCNKNTLVLSPDCSSRVRVSRLESADTVSAIVNDYADTVARK